MNQTVISAIEKHVELSLIAIMGKDAYIARFDNFDFTDGVIARAIAEYLDSKEWPETRTAQEKAGRDIAVNVRAMDRDTEYMKAEGLV